MSSYRLVKSMNYEDTIPMCIEAGLEMKPDEKAPEGLMVTLELFDEEADGKRIACGSLAYQHGQNLIRAVAVDEAYRGQGLGKKIVETLLEEARNRGIEDVMLTAKVVGFYEKLGFEVVPRAEAPEGFTDCIGCPKFHNGCDSEIMRLKR